MTYEQAASARVPVRRALAEIHAHGFDAWQEGGHIKAREWLGDEPQEVARVGRDGLVSGDDVLGWLGY